MRVLFVPAHGIAALGHGIPLLALSRQLDSSFVSAFLAPKPYWDFFRHRGANVLDVDHEELKTQMVAHALFKPDIVVDDFSFTTAFARQLTPFPRVTLQRTGSFPGETAATVGRRAQRRAGFQVASGSFLDGNTRPARIEDLLDADAFIVPGIRSVDVLPAQVQEDPRFSFSGFLVLKDSPCRAGCSVLAGRRPRGRVPAEARGAPDCRGYLPEPSPARLHTSRSSYAGCWNREGLSYRR